MVVGRVRARARARALDGGGRGKAKERKGETTLGWTRSLGDGINRWMLSRSEAHDAGEKAPHPGVPNLHLLR